MNVHVSSFVLLSVLYSSTYKKKISQKKKNSVRMSDKHQQFTDKKISLLSKDNL